ncbi:hypothetical protein [Maridesulfovibrio sp.]|uniref:hypothetical protein n=1 Tax=Maridesulfovibrio sp. TaxID=2795000 RepID=UPI002AA7A6E4|nr:hypothetical protein [Maridesulfovibrio sp.]
MQQLTLFHDENREMEIQQLGASLATLMPMVRSRMNKVAASHHLSRDLIAERMTDIARSSGVKLSRGNAKSVKTATLDKWLSPEDRDHPPSLQAIITFVMATGDNSPLMPLLSVLGLEVMTEEDKQLRDYAKADLVAEKAKAEKRRLKAVLR